MFIYSYIAIDFNNQLTYSTLIAKSKNMHSSTYLKEI
ncbi:Uncharacterised protein [Providencia rettgeri]|nr:Uncharacterised protein [Providencia rettgeri]